jgi:Flp pilus assembly secretin CpaC
MKIKVRNSTAYLGSLLVGAGLLTLWAGLALASTGEDSAQQVAVTLNAGETYVIRDLTANAAPSVHVVDNPKALVVNREKPGELELVAAAAGKWKIDVETASGDKVTYKVKVKASDDSLDSRAAARRDAAPEVMASRDATDDAPATSTALDAGSGPVAPTAKASISSLLPPVASTRSAGSAASAPTASGDASTAGPVVASTSSTPLGVMPAGSASSGSVAPAAAPMTLAAASSPAVLLPAMNSYPPPPSVAVNSAPVMSNQRYLTPMGRYKNDPPAVIQGQSVNAGTHYLPADVVELSAGSSSIYDFPGRIRRISIADTAVADLQVVNPFQINLVGHKEGFTTLAVWDTRGQYEERQVRVDPFGKQQVMLNVIVSEVNRSRLEEQGINWTVALPHLGISLLGLPGNVSTVNQGTSAPAGGGLIPLLLSTNVNYAIAGGNGDVQGTAFFQFLENHDLAKILAEPKLMANSGEKAEFLSGGEIPIVIAQALNTSIVFKEFGVSIVFVPTVVGNDDILLQVKPEVSEPDFAHGVSLFGFTVPAFVTRRAQTFVRLKNNQMLIIAGLLLRTKTSHITKAPYLGDIPYLGNLFKSTSYQDQQSDLVMAVTPQIIAPMAPVAQPWLPTDRPQLTAEDIRTKRIEPEDTSRPRF